MFFVSRKPRPPENYGSFFDIDTALRGPEETVAVQALFSDQEILHDTIASFGLARKNKHTEAVTVKAHADLLKRLLEWHHTIADSEIRGGFSQFHTAGGSLSLFDARVRQDDGRDKTYRQTIHFAQFVNWSSQNKQLFGKDDEGRVGPAEGIIKPDGGISASVVCKFDHIDDKPTLVDSESVMEPNESLTSLDSVTVGLRSQYELESNEVLYHIVCIVIEIKPPIVPELTLIGQTSCYAGGYHDVCGTSYGYAGRGPKAYRLLVLDNAIVFEGEGTSDDGVEVVGDFDTLEKRLKKGSVTVGRSLLGNNSEGEDGLGDKDGLDGELVKDVRKLFVAAIDQLKKIPRNGRPLRRLPSPTGPTWTTLRDKVKDFEFKNAVTQPERFFEAARMSKKKVAELEELRKRKGDSASAENAESGPRAEDSDFEVPPEGAESTEVNADAQPRTNIDSKRPKQNKKKTKRQSVNDPPPKDRRNRSPSPGGGGQGPTKGSSTRNPATRAGPSATTSSATKQGGQRGRRSGRGAKSAGRTVGHRAGNVRESNDNTTNVLKGKDSLESGSCKEEVRTPNGTYGEYDVASTDYDPLTASNLKNIGSYMPELNASEKVRSLHESMLMDPVMNGGQAHHNALTELRNIEEEVPKQTASGIMEDDIIDEEDNGSFDRAPSAVYDDPCQEYVLGDAEKRRAFNTKIQLLAARSVLRQANTIFVIASKEIFNRCLDEAIKFVHLAVQLSNKAFRLEVQKAEWLGKFVQKNNGNDFPKNSQKRTCRHGCARRGEYNV
ncbi:hypothetical protein L198_06462 [Cryptococcus wingfieldii CBS 7118]|uniref:Uncharacterized protein n=1 Tax=Cryptococcus wingfieldii CBS 7118 TaxID=1295528 RepID=A0A1E3IKM0_9TREE|nr:hypothetical protein L198_06462 [Cryptococcus wingfieldii CBS 7118]ODN89143.1 hypothetical protein L198_06462 [Cryptococcus wingfieldii CBS 7118]